MSVPVGPLDLSSLSRPADAQSSHCSPPSSDVSLISTPVPPCISLPSYAPPVTSGVLEKLRAPNFRVETNVGPQDEPLPNPDSASASEKASLERWASALFTLGGPSPSRSVCDDPMAASRYRVFDAPPASVATSPRSKLFLDDPHYAHVCPGITLGLCLPECRAPTLIWTCASWGNWATRTFTHIIRVRVEAEGTPFVAVHRSANEDGVQMLWLPLETRYWAGAPVPFDGREIRLSLHQLYEARRFLEDALGRPGASVLVVTPPGLQIEAAAIGVCIMAAAYGVSTHVASKAVDGMVRVSDVWKGHFTPMDLEFLEAVARFQCLQPC